MISSRNVNGWLYALIVGSIVVTLLLTTKILDTIAVPAPLPPPRHAPAPADSLARGEARGVHHIPPQPPHPGPIKSIGRLQDGASRINRAVKNERGLLGKELKYYRYSNGGNLSSLAPDLGGSPVRAMVATTWRSGSTFLGDIMNSHPATFYHYEPLLHFDIHQARSGPLAVDAVQTLTDLMQCNYTGLDRYLAYGKQHQWLFSHNERLWKYCVQDGMRRMRKSYCWKPEFLNRFCSLFPFQSIKTVRLRLNLTRQLVENPSLNVRVLLLVRDPRGTVQSRKHRDWCPGNPDCEDPAMLCRDLVDDHKALQVLQAQFPGRYKVFRYEDFSMNPQENTKEVFKFFGLTVHSTVTAFLASHTKANKGGVSSTFRDSKTAPFKWREKLTMDEVRRIQAPCREAMDLWGYARVEEESKLKTFSPVIDLKT